LDDPAEAEEVTQDVLNYALIHIDRYDAQRAKFSTWLHTITVSRCRDRRRRRYLPSVSLFAWLNRGGDTPDPAPGPEYHAIREATHDEVWEAIRSLSPKLREAILLRHWAECTYQEIGDILGCSLRVARSRVLRAYERLEPLLASSAIINQEKSLL
jgi:RNA polymerase sigma-70 factor (ECF subfamily)